jgi:hypothetical protein
MCKFSKRNTRKSPRKNTHVLKEMEIELFFKTHEKESRIRVSITFLFYGTHSGNEATIGHCLDRVL